MKQKPIILHMVKAEKTYTVGLFFNKKTRRVYNVGSSNMKDRLRQIHNSVANKTVKSKSGMLYDMITTGMEHFDYIELGKVFSRGQFNGFNNLILSYNRENPDTDIDFNGQLCKIMLLINQKQCAISYSDTLIDDIK